jgi:hypothetical protein
LVLVLWKNIWNCNQGCQIFLVLHTKMGNSIPNNHKIYQMAKKLTSSIARPSKIYQNWNFWFENMPSGNPVANTKESARIKSKHTCMYTCLFISVHVSTSNKTRIYSRPLCPLKS